jgi:hypothetical protein
LKRKDEIKDACKDIISKKKNKHGTLFYIGERGKIITLRGYKIAGVVLMAVFTLIVSISIIFYLLYTRTEEINISLRESLTATRQKMEAFKKENEILMARVVVAEAKLHMKNAPAKETNKKNMATAKKETTEKKDLGKQSNEISGQQSPVAIEDFELLGRQRSGQIKVRFKVKNMKPGSGKVSGCAVVVLKDGDSNQDHQIILPRVALKDGVPTGKKGARFSMTNYQTIRLRSRHRRSINYRSATVFIFDNTGELRLKKEYAIPE